MFKVFSLFFFFPFLVSSERRGVTGSYETERLGCQGAAFFLLLFPLFSFLDSGRRAEKQGLQPKS